MIKEYLKFVKTLRVQRGFSQLDVANRLGISRPSYIAVEQGKRDLSLPEAQKLANIFGVSLKEIEGGIMPNYKKYKQMILAYLRNSASGDGKMPKTKLAKLLYLADFAWFYEHLESMSGMAYRKIQYGPVPDVYFRAVDELFESGEIDIEKTKEGALLISQTRTGEKEGLSELNAQEKALIKEISKKWENKRTQDIVNFTHNQMPYFLCRDNEIIPYELITQENPDNVY